MKEYVPLVVLVLVMLGGLYSLDSAYNYSYEVAFGNYITGAQVAEGECNDEIDNDGDGKADYKGVFYDDDDDFYSIYDPDPGCSSLDDNDETDVPLCTPEDGGYACKYGGKTNTEFQCEIQCVPGGIPGSQEPGAAAGQPVLSCTPKECAGECLRYDDKCEAQEDNSCCTVQPKTNTPIVIEEKCREDNNEWVCKQDDKKRANTEFQCDVICTEPGEGPSDGQEDGNDEPVEETVSDAELLGTPVNGIDLAVAIDAPSNMVTGNTYEIKVRVANRGDQRITLTRFFTFLYLDNGKRITIDRRETNQLGAREIERLTFRWAPPHTLEGSYKILAITDIQDTINEGANENNNEDTKTVEIRKAGAGNLIIDCIEKVDRTDDLLMLEITFKNGGEARIQRNPNTHGTIFLPVNVKARGPVTCEQDTYLYDPEEIRPGENKVVTASMEKSDGEPCILTRGNYIIEATIDNAGGLIIENTADNYKSISLPFKTQAEIQCSGKDTGFRPVGIEKYCDVDGVLRPELPNGVTCSNSFECQSNLCFGDKCVAVCEHPGSGKVFPLGFRSGTLYCTSDGELISRTNSGECSEHFECMSELCVEGRCVKANELSKVDGDKLKDALCKLDLFASGVCD